MPRVIKVIFDGFATANYLDSWVAEEGKEVQRPVVYKMDPGFLGRPKANGNQVTGGFGIGFSIEHEEG